jgi:hypothetical protein
VRGTLEIQTAFQCFSVRLALINVSYYAVKTLIEKPDNIAVAGFDLHKSSKVYVSFAPTAALKVELSVGPGDHPP